MAKVNFLKKKLLNKKLFESYWIRFSFLAIKQAQSVFFHLSDASAREKELIKGVPEMEAINTMMGKVKVSAPNLEASKRKKGGKK